MRSDLLPVLPAQLPRLALSVAVCAASQGWAAPSGGIVQQGEAQISIGTHTLIQQSSQGAEIHWDRFDIGAHESVTFQVPNSQAYTLNHIHDFKPSEIYGNLTSNGTVILANPNGIYFGAGSVVNVNSLVATTANVSLEGHQLTLTPGGQPSAIEHWGDSTATQSLAFFAPRLEVGGSIDSANIELSNHSTGVITLLDSGIGFMVDDAIADQLAQEGIHVSGELRASGGYIGLSTSAMDSLANTALNMDGLVSVSSITEDAGQVVLRSDRGTTWISGDIDASSTGGQGGEISIQGHQIGVVGQASVRADGATGGGTIDVGSGVVGDIDRASQVYAGHNTRITTNATEEGDGGSIELWSTEVTQVYGRLEATGAGQAGSGGFIETSSEQRLHADAEVDVSAAGGHSGTWLLDPGDIFIGNFVDDNVVEDPDGLFSNTDDGQDSWLSLGSLLNSLQNEAHVTVMTTAVESDIYLENDLDLSAIPVQSSLTLDAVRDIHLNADILNGIGNNFTLTLQSGGGVYTTNQLIQVGTLNIDSATVSNNQDLEIDAFNVLVQDGLVWDAVGDVAFATNSNITALNSVADASLQFKMAGNDLALYSVSGLNTDVRIGTLEITNTGTLTISGNIRLGSSDLDLESGVGQILIGGTNVRIDTQGSNISLANIAGTGGNSINISNASLPGGVISLNDLDNMNNLTVTSGDSIQLSTGTINVDESIVLNANQVDLSNSFHFISATENIFVNADIEGHQGGDTLLIMNAEAMALQNFGLDQAIRGMSLQATDNISVGGYINAELFFVQADQFVLLEDTTIQSEELAQFSNTPIFSGANHSLSIAAQDYLELFDVVVGSLSATSTDMVLNGSIQATTGGIDLGAVDQLTLSQNTELQSSGSGVLTLANNIGGGFGLDLTVQNGALNLGSQNHANPLAYLNVTNLNPGAGQNTIGGDIRVAGALDLSQSGNFAFSPIDPTATELVLTSDTGTIRLDGSTLNLQGHDLTLAAADGTAWVGSILNANEVAVSAQDMRLGGSIAAAGALDLGDAGALNLIGNSQLTGVLSLGTTNDNVAINGHYSLSINNLGQSLTLYEVGGNQALTSLTVTHVDTLRLVEPLVTQGSAGVSLSGNQWLLTEDAQINTAAANGTINLSGIAVNGPHSLTLNAGDGTVSLGAVGQSGRLESLVLQQASALELGGDISTNDERLDFSVVQAIELIADTRIDSSQQDGNISLGSGSIDGTYDLTLISGDGELIMGAIGQNIALQNLRLETTADLTLDQSINVVDQLSVSADSLATNGRLSSSGGQVQLFAAEGIAMGAQAEVFGYEGVIFDTVSGDINVGFVESERGLIELVASEGSIFNAIGDFVNIKDTSVNVQGPRVSLIAGEGIGTSPVDPLVLDVATDGLISLEFGEPVAYIVNINGTAINQTSAGVVFDTLLAAQQAGSRLSAQLMPPEAPWRLAIADESLTQIPESLLFAVTQPGFQIPSNVVLAGDAISSQRPTVPGLLFDGRSWRLEYPLRSDQ